MLNTTLWPFLTSLLIAAISIPVIIRVAALKHLMDEPDEDRKLHKHKTPTLGGVAIFAGTLFAFSAFSDFLKLPEITFMIPALILLFFAGIKDDILVLSPLKKLGVQIFCAALIVVLGNLRLTSLWGIFGITDISPFTGITITLFLIVALINAFNLIDGINGLAGGLGLISSTFFGIWFVLTDHMSLSVLSFSLAGALLGFLYYNFKPSRIFMGDTGSMMIGFIVSILAIKFIESNRSGIESSPYFIKAAPGVAVAAVLIPLLDMTRVFFYRLSKKKSPFSADRSHIHHILQDIGLSHEWISILLWTSSVAIIGVSLYLRDLRSMEVVLILIGICSVAIGFAAIARKKQNKIKSMSSTKSPKIASIR